MGTTRAGTERCAERRILVGSYATALFGPTRDPSPRQLPTNHDYAGGPHGPIREYQSDQPSMTTVWPSLGSSPLW
jgi:hypothetical protein